LLGVWSGLHGAEWYIEARVEEHHWYMPRTTGQAGYGWAQLQPGASHPTQKTPKSSMIFLLNGLYLHRGTWNWTLFQQHKLAEWLYLQVIEASLFTPWRNRVSVPTRIHLVITVLLRATCIHEFSLPATSHTFMWLHSLTTPETTFTSHQDTCLFQQGTSAPNGSLPNSITYIMYPLCWSSLSSWTAKILMTEAAISSETSVTIQMTLCLIPEDLPLQKCPYYNTYLSVSSVIMHLSMSELFQFCR
jgi:hypothetical protein